MSERINEEKLKAHYEKAKQQAEDIIEDPDRVKKIAERAWEKAKDLKGPLAEVWDQLKLMIQMIRAWVSGEYREVPTTSLIAIIAGLIYLLSPIDLIPDMIPVLGYLDDIFVLGVVFTQVAKDLRAFEAWQQAHSEKTPDTDDSSSEATTAHESEAPVADEPNEKDV
ncbi:YkvA family protein [Reinekea blandensis]|uniref:DUF1232 domain-containing protein n=1 Tax=Reinekea blandensis MED297 TaxID=314283 RepID=A4BHZ7_9GAMM|nr:hypothetical protein MED297_14002 [Reinekea sp. MED297] [Reinekea blandensis MED297]